MEIQVFYLNLTFNRLFSVASYNPYSVSEYNNKLYIGTLNGKILVIQNEAIKNISSIFSGMVFPSVNSIWFDEYGYIAAICNDPINRLNFYYQNGTSHGGYLSTLAFPRYIGFDAKGRFVLISVNNICIYNK
jgi:hypothetical protein